MNIFLIASAILLAVIIPITRSRQRKITEKSEKTFWEREHQANAVRRKSLDSLKLIRIPLESLPMETMQEDPQAAEYRDLLQELATRPIANFTGYTNTDLKLEYGTANISLLSEYDQNYTLLVSTLQKWADLLLEKGFKNDAIVIMEYAITTDTDVSRTYYLLAEHYAASGEQSRIRELLIRAENLRSSQGKLIARTLREKYLPETP